MDVDKVLIKKLDDVFVQVITEPGIKMEMAERFTFMVPGAQFSKLYKSRVWDGKIKLLNSYTGMIYGGLTEEIEKFCESFGYEYEYLYDNSDEEFSVQEAQEFAKTLKLPFKPHDHQVKAFVHCVRKRRCLLLAPTSSGKSLVAYLLTKYYSNHNVLIIVPRSALVMQLCKDFQEYGIDEDIHFVVSGQEKVTDKRITISTWQSIAKLSPSFFKRFSVVIGDEAHNFKAKSLIGIMTKLQVCPYRFGMTGSLDGTQTNQLVLEGLFGPVFKVTTTKELMEKKIVSNLMIKTITLSYPEEVRKQCRKLKYKEEIDFLLACRERNNFLANLALSLTNNTLLLFRYEDHGKTLYEMIKSKDPDRNCYFVNGTVDVDVREEIRQAVEGETNSIIIGSYGTFSEGISIKNLHNLIFSSPFKGKIQNLQAIGRSLRIHSSKDQAMLYDISDDLSIKTHKNMTLEHFLIRLKVYISEGFEYKPYKVKLKIQEP